MSAVELIDGSTGEIVALQSTQQWKGAAIRGLEARNEREAIVAQILRQGHDFGTIPGCGDKPALLKPGAEKIADALGLYPDYEELDKIQDFNAKIWFYRYRCRLRQRGSDAVMSTGIGSCNSEAAKYKFRDGQRLCPDCGKAAIIKGREEYGGGWLCFSKKGGCGMKFGDNDKQITEQQTGQIENPDLASLVNTVDKMAQKSAFVAACLNLGFSEQFTQDIDDNPSAFSSDTRPTAARPKETPDQVAIRELMAQAEKLLPPDSKKLAQLRGIKDPNELGKKVQILVDLKNQKAKTANVQTEFEGDEIADQGRSRVKPDERAGWIETVSADFIADGRDQAEYLIENYDGAELSELSIEQLKAIHEDLTIPF